MNDPMSEILDRVKRIETRVTIMGRHVGADVGGGRPLWNNGRITVPTRNCSIGEMMKVVPPRWSSDIHVYHDDEYLFSINDCS